jgi:micrococcal nuclease
VPFTFVGVRWLNVIGKSKNNTIMNNKVNRKQSSTHYGPWTERIFISSFLFMLLVLPATMFSAQGKSTAENVKVIKVIDGDTFDVVEKDSTFRVRLNGIDAPESGQEFYEESKQFLAELAINHEIILERKGTDRYGRILANIIRSSDHLNINYEMVHKGMAWHYAKYSDDTQLAKLEAEAREKQVGLWSLYHYTAPWEYRKGN